MIQKLLQDPKTSQETSKLPKSAQVADWCPVELCVSTTALQKETTICNTFGFCGSCGRSLSGFFIVGFLGGLLKWQFGVIGQKYSQNVGSTWLIEMQLLSGLQPTWEGRDNVYVFTSTLFLQ